MHSVDRAIFNASREELFALDGAGHDIADQRVSLGQVGREVHLLPLEHLPNAQARKAEVGADSGTLDQVEQAV